MIGRLTGLPLEETEGAIVLDVNGVGYEVLGPMGTLGRAPRKLARHERSVAEHVPHPAAQPITHVRNTLMAGFTTIRDLGTEGAGNSDVGIKQAIEQGIIPGPRMLVVTRAIVATGAYGPPRDLFSFEPPQGAQEADGPEVQHAVRQQIGNGADWVKMYADYGWGPGNQQRPTFSEEELALAVETARSSGRAVSTHATTAEGMRRAIAAGVETIEHGDDGTPEIFRSMVAHHIALCPTVEASYAIATYRGWHPGTDPEPPSIAKKRASLRAALKPGARFGIIDRHGNGADHGLNEPIVRAEVEAAGFRQVARYDFTKADGQDYFLIFEKR